MASKRGLSNAGAHRNRASGSRFPLAILIFFALLVPLIFFVGRGLHISDCLFLDIGKRNSILRLYVLLLHA
ncbi:hypothetical protein ACFX13_041310 [Malus domestica]|uniref:Uncharacterized protein n=1 Tax=Malus domestica TaxID=3750 RepID=A0A498JHM5_MALDO|nr:hypothetical protein DVH24_014120 [Malus domestica]